MRGQGGLNKAAMAGSTRDGREGCFMLGWRMGVKGERERVSQGGQGRG